MQPVETILNTIVIRYRTLLQDNLVGIYLHGSLAMGCFNPGSSDIDFIVVIREDIPDPTKRELVNVLLKLGEDGPAKDFEMSVVLREFTKNFVYPTPFVLHYSQLYRNRYLKDPQYLCANGVDEDLVSHFTVIYHRGKSLFGLPIRMVFSEVPKAYYVQSILNDVKDADIEIVQNPVYTILNFCRILIYLKEGKIVSKKEGGEWGVENLPVRFHDLVYEALSVYNGAKENGSWDNPSLKDFVTSMKIEIDKLH